MNLKKLLYFTLFSNYSKNIDVLLSDLPHANATVLNCKSISKYRGFWIDYTIKKLNRKLFHYHQNYEDILYIFIIFFLEILRKKRIQLFIKLYRTVIFKLHIHSVSFIVLI